MRHTYVMQTTIIHLKIVIRSYFFNINLSEQEILNIFIEHLQQFFFV